MRNIILNRSIATFMQVGEDLTVSPTSYVFSKVTQEEPFYIGFKWTGRGFVRRVRGVKSASPLDF